MPLFNLSALQSFANLIPFGQKDDTSNTPTTSITPSNNSLNLSSNPESIANTSNDKFDPDVASKAQSYIDNFAKGKSLPAKVTGQDIAIASAMYNIPPSLILAQGQIENGFLTDPSGKRALNTNNPMSVGLYDNGQNKFKFPTVTDGVLAYAKLLNDNYLQGGKVSTDQLLQNFVDKNGNKYASSSNYEKNLQSVVKKVKKIGLN